MREFRTFLGLIVLFLGLTTWINLAQPSFDVYGKGQPYLQLLNKIPTAKTDTAVAKIKHARQTAPYELGLFGNSRIWMVSQEHIGTEHRVFNFAVPGQSFRQSVLLLKELTGSNKVPSTVVISFDHVALQLSEDPVYPTMPRRWLERSKDFFYITQHYGLKKGLVFIYNNAFFEYELLSQALSFNYLWPKAKLLFAEAFGLSTGSGPRRPGDYRVLRADGSRSQSEAEKQKIIVPDRNVYDFTMLEHDLSELQKVQKKSKARIIIYESPLHPDFSDRVEKNLGDVSLKIRATLKARCTDYGFSCFPSPRLAAGAKGPYWRDFSHAPSGLLGQWIRQLYSGHPHPLANAEFKDNGANN